MKVVLLVALLVGLALSEEHQTVSDHSQKQKDVFRLFHHIQQPSFYKDHIDTAQNFQFFHNTTLFTKPEVVDEFHEQYHYGSLLKKGEIFSVYYYEHLHQAISLFKVLYYAKTYETFYNVAVWARQNVNEGIFVYAFSVALVHRPDTYFLVLPPIYEIFPHFFFNNEAIQKAHYFKQIHNNDQVIYANYSGDNFNLHPEQSLSYFTEDLGVNANHYYYHIYYPFWMSGEEFHLKDDHRGEVFFHHHQQLLARFYLERLSNNFGEIEEFDWEVPFETGYHPGLHYPNGVEFPSRHSHVDLHGFYYHHGQKVSFNSPYTHSFTHVQDYERRFRDAIQIGYYFDKKGEKVDLTTHDGVNTLGNLVEGNPDSHFYRHHGAYHIFAHHLLGYSYQPLDYHHAYPSALEHYETQVRDPAFFQYYKKVLNFYYRHLYQQKPYKKSELIFEGVHVKQVEFDRLITYFDSFKADLSNAIYVTEEEFQKNEFKVHVEQERLTHKPFHYKIHVDSDKEQEVVVKVFLGPKFDDYERHINLSHNFVNFVQFDHFRYKLKPGDNVIVKNSEDIVNYLHDRVHYHELYQKAHESYDKNEIFQFPTDQLWYGFPEGFYLPIGSHDGTPYQFFVVVYPSEKQPTGSTHVVGSGTQYVDDRSLFYPFDKPIFNGKIFHEIPNAFFYETKIYHRTAEDVKSNASH